MTPKELLYLEDSLGMEQQLETKCNDYAAKVQDPTLQAALRQFAGQHNKHFQCLFKQLQ